MLNFNDITLRRGPTILIEGFSGTIYPGQKLGLTGANGSGKTSLLELILGHLDADRGELEKSQGIRIAYLAQETPQTAVSARDYVLQGDSKYCRLRDALILAETESRFEEIAELHEEMAAIDGYNAISRAEQLLQGLGFRSADFDLPVAEFSGGWQIRLNLARCLMTPSDLLLLDEPTNHLDLDAVLWLSNWLSTYTGTLILISHDREFLDETTNTIASLEHGQLTFYKGNYSAFEKQRAEKLALQQSTYLKQQAEIARMKDFVRRFRAKASKARQAQSRLKALQKMELISAAHVDSPFGFQIPHAERVSDPLLRLEDAVLGYQTPLLSSVNLSIRPGDRIGLLGANGMGKSTLIKTLAGELTLLQGQRLEGPNLQIGYFSQQHMDRLEADSTPLAHMQQLDKTLTEKAIRTYLGGFDFTGDKALACVENFSGGEKARLSLALVTWSKPNLLLLDEPANHLDIQMRQALSESLQAFEGAMIIVSHDRHLLAATVEEFLLVSDGTVTPFDGDLMDYHRSLTGAAVSPGSTQGTAAENKRHSNQDRGSSSGKPTEHRSRKNQETGSNTAYVERKQLRSAVASLEKRLVRLNRKLAEAEAILSQPDAYNDPDINFQALLRDQTSLQEEISKTEEEWLEQSEKLEQFT